MAPAATVDLPCQPLPTGPVHVAKAFSVTQVGADGRKKVRRCEDYRRSHDNSTILVSDRPEHDDIEVYVQSLRLAHSLGLQSCLWCQDLADAYRSFPVMCPNHAYMLLGTPSGPTLWRHRALPFGSTASVWHFGRIIDALCWLVRSFLVICVLHYVDDLGGIHDMEDAESGYEQFTRFCQLLGFRLKPSKAQAPSREQKLLGVIIWVEDEGNLSGPGPRASSEAPGSDLRHSGCRSSGTRSSIQVSREVVVCQQHCLRQDGHGGSPPDTCQGQQHRGGFFLAQCRALGSLEGGVGHLRLTHTSIRAFHQAPRPSSHLHRRHRRLLRTRGLSLEARRLRPPQAVVGSGVHPKPQRVGFRG